MVKIHLPIISGSLKSRRVEITKNEGVRPILSRARATLFDILNGFDHIENFRVLDICAGSGIFGIEALSRGAQEAVFFDIDKKVCRELEENLTRLNLMSKAKVINTNVFFPGNNKEEPFSLVFLDLPYKSTFLVHKIVRKFFENNWVDKETIFVIATSSHYKFENKDMFLFHRDKSVASTKILFLQLNPEYRVREKPTISLEDSMDEEGLFMDEDEVLVDERKHLEEEII